MSQCKPLSKNHLEGNGCKVGHVDWKDSRDFFVRIIRPYPRPRSLYLELNRSFKFRLILLERPNSCSSREHFAEEILQSFVIFTSAETSFLSDRRIRRCAFGHLKSSNKCNRDDLLKGSLVLTNISNWFLTVLTFDFFAIVVYSTRPRRALKEKENWI